MSLAIVRARPIHVRLFAGAVRSEDEAEAFSMTHEGAEEGARESLAQSTLAFTTFCDGEPLAMAGVVPGVAIAGCGMPWVLSGQSVERHRRTYVEASRLILGRFLEVYPVLMTVMSARYERAVRWARALGFRVSEPFPYGPDGAPFVLIERRA